MLKCNFDKFKRKTEIQKKTGTLLSDLACAIELSVCANNKVALMLKITRRKQMSHLDANFCQLEKNITLLPFLFLPSQPTAKWEPLSLIVSAKSNEAADFCSPYFRSFLPFDVLLTTIIRSDWGNLSPAFILFQLQSLLSSRLCGFLS